MTDTKFTPGPWRVGEDDSLQGNGDLPILRDKTNIALIMVRRPLQFGSEAETVANAHLIAAAPDMYEALEYSMVYLAGKMRGAEQGNIDRALHLIRQAVTKARGGWSAADILKREG